MERQSSAAVLVNTIAPLHAALFSGRCGDVDAYLRMGGVSAIDAAKCPDPKSGLCALHVAAIANKKECLRHLLNAGCDANARCFEKRTPLHYAALYSHIEIGMALLESKCEVDPTDHQDQTPLFVAAFHGNTEFCELLLKHGANVETIANDDWTVFTAAASGNFPETLKVLLKHLSPASAILCLPLEFDPLNALLLAAERGHLECCHVLLSAGPYDLDVGAVTETGASALHYIASTGDAKLMKLALRQPDIDLEADDNLGRTPLFYAVVNDCMHSALVLLQAGSIVDTRDDHDRTPLIIASAKSLRDMVRMLLEAGANTALVNDRGYNAAHLTADPTIRMMIQSASAPAQPLQEY